MLELQFQKLLTAFLTNLQVDQPIEIWDGDELNDNMIHLSSRWQNIYVENSTLDETECRA